MKSEKHGTNGSLNCEICKAHRERIHNAVNIIIEETETKEELKNVVDILQGAIKERK